MKNLHKITPPLPKHVIKLAETWFPRYGNDYQLVYKNGTIWYYYKHAGSDDGEEEGLSPFWQNADWNLHKSEVAAVNEWLKEYPGVIPMPFEPRMVEIR